MREVGSTAQDVGLLMMFMVIAFAPEVRAALAGQPIAVLAVALLLLHSVVEIFFWLKEGSAEAEEAD